MSAARTRTRLTPFGKAVVALVAASGTLGLIRWGLSGAESEPTAGQRPGATSPLPSALTESTPLPDCIYGDLPADHTGYDQWDRTLLDPAYRVPQTYVPPDLRSVNGAGFEGDFRVRSFVLTDLGKLACTKNDQHNDQNNDQF